MGVTLIVAGSILESAQSRQEFGAALSVVVKPAGVEHADEVGPRGASTLQITFDAGAARELLDGGRGLERWRWLHADRVVASMLSVLRLARRREIPSEADMEDRALDAIAALATDEPPLRGVPAWLRRVREALDDGAGRTSVRDLAREAGVHEVSLSRAFRRCFGCTTTEYRRRVRLRRAAAEIETGCGQLSRIAHAAGFADHAHMCRDFGGTTGVTPSVYRDLARGTRSG
ncbi:MAG TPA: helix-turn-helix domain-containing protein [Longimicrobiales bacterium]|nr:helix-turn-helix domain-containing protein [Longimicrobiales bacterium]